MEITCRRFVPAEGDALVDFLTAETWPFHSSDVLERDQVQRWISEGRYEGEESRTFWIVAGERSVGLVRLMDLGDDTPLFDLRIRSRDRGKGLGSQALRWITTYVFEEFPRVRRIEGTTRQDNAAMRRTFERCGYAKEAHYRDAWPGAGGTVHDAVGYAILRRDWRDGTVSAPQWHDEHVTADHRPAPGPC
ncbi:GNAT family N-acetyltransferase [Streptomyces sp. NPDC002138]|uniref:GNAT family N-acetyltransferase n=1 Tax=Streptomyces sp. NPDC002138 TaxID=3154410 RepID=UPI003316A426